MTFRPEHITITILCGNLLIQKETLIVLIITETKNVIYYVMEELSCPEARTGLCSLEIISTSSNIDGDYPEKEK